MSSDDLWAAYQKARIRRAKAEVKAIEAREAVDKADNEYAAAVLACDEAGSAWHASLKTKET